MGTEAIRAFHQVLPPTNTGKQMVQSVSTANSVDVDPLFTGLGANAPTGWVYVAFEAVTTDCYIRLRSDNVNTGISSTTGMLIKAGQPAVSFWVDSDTYLYVNHIAPGGAGSLKWYVASPDYEEE